LQPVFKEGKEELAIPVGNAEALTAKKRMKTRIGLPGTSRRLIRVT
jgi:hypothetical protein